jgi:hypothetical protein
VAGYRASSGWPNTFFASSAFHDVDERRLVDFLRHAWAAAVAASDGADFPYFDIGLFFPLRHQATSLIGFSEGGDVLQLNLYRAYEDRPPQSRPAGPTREPIRIENHVPRSPRPTVTLDVRAFRPGDADDPSVRLRVFLLFHNDKPLERFKLAWLRL